jgi:hypothetical protein
MPLGCGGGDPIEGSGGTHLGNLYMKLSNHLCVLSSATYFGGMVLF